MKVLNLYAGIGGNRKLWTNVEVTAVEWDEKIAAIYQDFFPDDKVIVTDAHEYLVKHFKEFDFIWSSIECTSHSRVRFWASVSNKRYSPIYPDLKLYEEILFLVHYFKGLWIVENVKPFYVPLIAPNIEIGRHCFWTNFLIRSKVFPEANINRGIIKDWQKLHGFDISNYKINKRKDKVLRNCVLPELGLHILECARGIIKEQDVTQKTIFD